MYVVYLTLKSPLAKSISEYEVFFCLICSVSIKWKMCHLEMQFGMAASVPVQHSPFLTIVYLSAIIFIDHQIQKLKRK